MVFDVYSILKTKQIAELQVREWLFSLMFHEINFSVFNQAIDLMNKF